MKKELTLMAFSPTHGPVYGGESMTIQVETDNISQAGAKYFVVFEGIRQRHVVSAHLSVSENCLTTYIPGHGQVEQVQVSLIQLIEETGTYATIAQCYYQYESDSIYQLTKFLISSVYNNHALDNLERVMADRFHLSNVTSSTLDIKLSRSLRNANLLSSWHLLGGDSINDAHCEERETLLHLCARLGLQQVAHYLLEQPGKEDALLLPNRQEELPHTLARQNGFHDLADMLSGYNTEGLTTSEQDTVQLDNAVLRSYGNGTASLTSFLNVPCKKRSIENEINFVKETEEMMKVQRGYLSQISFNSDWPSINLQQNTVTSMSLPALPLDQEIKETIDRLLTQHIKHNNHVQTFLRTSFFPVSDGACTLSTGSFHGENGGSSNVDTRDAGDDQRFSTFKTDTTFRESVVNNSSQPYNILEGSLSGIRDLTESLFQLREVQRFHRLSRDVRKRHLSRFSLSCPSLSETFPYLSVVGQSFDGDYYKSMHDLAVASGNSPNHKQVITADIDQHKLLTESSNSLLLNQETSFDQNIRICINGVTVDSSQDFPTGPSSPSLLSHGDTGTASDRKNSRLGNSSGQADAIVSRGSWSHSGSIMKSSLPLNRRDQQTRVRMLTMTGRSLSLTSLDGEDESEEEDYLNGARDEHPLSIFMPINAYGFAGARDMDARSDSPIDSSGSSPGREGPNQTKILGELSLSSYNAKSLTDLSTATDTSKTQHEELILQGSLGGSKHGAHHTYVDSGSLAVTHSSMTKSLSTPSIPQATEAAEDRVLSLRERREGKHQEDNQFHAQNYLEELEAQFRRQKEIEEEEDEDSTSNIDKKAEISWKDFINEELSPNDSDDKSSKSFKKEDKKRKPNVFSRLHSSYRTKKNKEKETKQKERHHFVAISVSNAAACDVCHKPMANKAALRCENCLVSVHEHTCKDHVTLCDKNRNKALHRDGSSHAPPLPTLGGLLERQSVSVTGTSLRPSQSFKDKRSVSAPVKTQPSQQLSAPAQLSHRHSLPTSSLLGSPPNNIAIQWQASAMGRFSVLDKAISEESEVDGMSVTTSENTGHSNMTDTISESMESLDAVVSTETSCWDDEPDLQLSVEEPEAWSITADKKTLKKLSTKDIKRQDTIWELINTEKQYVKRLKIMQKIFSQSMQRDLNITEDQVDRLFPRLDELLELHANFLRQLLTRQAKNEDRSVDEIGDVLVDQFQDSAAEKMKSVYGVFCSKHTEAMQLYKELVRADRKFQIFAKKCTNLPVCEKRDISDFILGVTVRLSKYPILIEAVLKSTKDKKDRENLSHALLLSKDVVQNIDEKVAAYEKLMDIHNKMDSRAVTYKDKKFKRQDLLATHRELVYSGKIGWKSARGRVYDVLAVVLTDLIVFLQKNEQKYTFLMQDNKSCVIPLHNLLVREKRDAKDSLGIYMISQNHTTPEMYELVCQSKVEREEWIRILQDAIRACPPDVEHESWPSATNPLSGLLNEDEKRRKDEHTNQIKTIIDQLHQKDEAIRLCCDEKNKLMLELWDLSIPHVETGSRPNSQEIVNLSESVDIVQAAMQEASRLTTIIQGSGSQLSRSVSSVVSVMKQRFVNVGPEDDEGRSASLLSLEQQEVDSSFSDAPEITPAAKDITTVETKPSVGSIQSYPSPLQHGTNAHLWEEQASSDRSSDRGSLGELSAASVSSLIHSPSNQEQMTSILHLVQYLNTLMNLTSKQCTKVECLRVELADAKEEIAKLSADMQGRRSVYRHDQLEELRNLQENISRERQDWERDKLQDRSKVEMEKEKLENEWKEIEKEKRELRLKKEELKREREVLQRQIDMMKEQGYQVCSTLNDTSTDPDSEKVDDNSAHHHRPMSHRRSASADFYNTVAISDVENIQNHPPYAGETVKGFPRQPRLSMSSLPGANNNKQAQLPMHLLSARNEQRVGGVNVQCLPLKLSGSNSNTSQQQLPVTSSSPAFLGGAHSKPPGRTGSSGVSRVQSMSAATRSALTHQENRHMMPSGLARVMKLADPKVKSTAGPPAPPQPVPTASSQVSKTEDGQKTPEGVIYF